MIRFFALLLLLIAATPAQAADFDYAAFDRIPILHEGRVKPLGAFAAVEQKRIGGKGDASAWLAQVLFDPSRAAQAPLFGTTADRGKNHTLEDALASLEPRRAEILSLLGAEKPDDLPRDQRDLLALHDRALLYAQLLGSLGMVLPVEGTDDKTYLDLRRDEQDIAKRARDIVRRKGTNPDKYTESERALLLQAMRLDFLSAGGRQNDVFRVVPPQWRGDAEWRSPWMILAGGGSPRSAAYLDHWKTMADAWRTGNAAGFSAAASAARDAAFADDAALSRARFEAELLYRAAAPFHAACALYALALLLFAAGCARPAYIVAAGGVLLHVAGIALRVYILSRPPVGTLYESVLFVSVIALIPALLSGFARRDPRIAACGIVVAVAVLLSAPVFAPMGDSLGVLVAVLNTGFWLATHVICITAGYGVCVTAASLAHVALWRQGRQGGESLTPVIQRMLAAALLLTAVGTVLGGIWADQSWGRFWGWDPKENGALLIVLWIAWILHGRMAGMLAGRAWLAAVCALNVVVALSWFGVNLLNVGLHSYGFTSGIAAGLFLFCAGEAAFIAFSLRGKKHAA